MEALSTLFIYDELVQQYTEKYKEKKMKINKRKTCTIDNTRAFQAL